MILVGCGDGVAEKQELGRSFEAPPRTTHVDVADAPYPLASDPLWRPNTSTTFASAVVDKTQYLEKTVRMAKSIFQRKRDLVYLVFFIIHVPVMLGEFFSVLDFNAQESHVLYLHYAL
jgi:hypothetical protein